MCLSEHIAQPLKMRGLYLVEPVVAMFAFSSYLMYPLLQQYVYRRLWQQLTNTTYPASSNSHRCGTNSSSNQSSDYEVSYELHGNMGDHVYKRL